MAGSPRYLTVTSPQDIAQLKEEILQLTRAELNPLREIYHYGDYDLQSFISWQPIVLIIGNYSAGKSTFINELVGENLQRTGQAPTDDCFTVITYQEKSGGLDIEERDGRVLLGDESLPFKRLKSQGERFLSHFRLKKIRADILKNLVLIDTPGMLDSISEKDRGYNYQEVIGELASLADLVILLFDAHKAGTVRESYHSLRTTLPEATMEDRVLFALNRVDECQNMDDLIRVHGALCWNLSQMTGRKDIPLIYLMFSPPEGDQQLSLVRDPVLKSYLQEIAYQKQEVIHQILDVPRKRMDHLVTYLEVHCQRIYQYICAYEQWMVFNRQARYALSQWCTLGMLMILGGGGWLLLAASTPHPLSWTASTIMALGGVVMIRAWLMRKFFRGSKLFFINHLDKFVTMQSQYEKDHWQITAPQIKQLLLTQTGQLPERKLVRLHKNDMATVIQRVAYLRGHIAGLSPQKTQYIRGETMTISTSTHATLAPGAEPNLAVVAPGETTPMPAGATPVPAGDAKMTKIIDQQIHLLDQEQSSESIG